MNHDVDTAAWSHQQLLDAFVSAELSVIGEHSGNFLTDWKELVEKVEAHAAVYDLSTDCLADIRQMIEDAETDA